MRLIKSALIVAFVALLAAFIFSEYRSNSLGLDEGPTLNVPDTVPEISVNDSKELLLDGVTAYDSQDGELTSEVEISGISRLLSDNTAEVTYIVFDSNDNMASASRKFKYTDYSRPTISLVSPLVFTAADTTGLISHFTASDVIDGDISDRVRISSLVPSSDSNIYYVSVLVSNNMGDSAKLKLPVIISPDANAPVITLSSYLEYINVGADFDPAAFISSVTYLGESLSRDVVKITGNVDTTTAGTYHVFYEYTLNDHTGRVALTVSVR